MRRPINHPPVHAFVSRRDTNCRELKTTAKIVCGDKSMDAIVQWDTGASCSCISKKVVETLQPTRRGFRTVLTPNGSAIRGVYLLDFMLPQGVLVTNIMAIETDIGEQGIEALIGMDIISMGDFAVSNFNNELVFTFRTPSIETTDYVAVVNRENMFANIQQHGQGNTRKRHKK